MGEIAEGWNGYALLHNAASRVGGIDIGFVPHNGGVCSADQVKLAGKDELDVLFLLGADEYDTTAMGKAFVVYVGTHGDAGAHRADVILPAADLHREDRAPTSTPRAGCRSPSAPCSRRARPRKTGRFSARCSAVLGMPLPFNSLRALRAAMYAEFPHLAQIDQIVPGRRRRHHGARGRAIKTDGAKLTSPVGDFYLTNPIARASAIMAECSQMQAGLKQAAE